MFSTLFSPFTLVFLIAYLSAAPSHARHQTFGRHSKESRRRLTVQSKSRLFLIPTPALGPYEILSARGAGSVHNDPADTNLWVANSTMLGKLAIRPHRFNTRATARPTDHYPKMRTGSRRRRTRPCSSPGSTRRFLSGSRVPSGFCWA